MSTTVEQDAERVRAVVAALTDDTMEVVWVYKWTTKHDEGINVYASKESCIEELKADALRAMEDMGYEDQDKTNILNAISAETTSYFSDEAERHFSYESYSVNP